MAKGLDKKAAHHAANMPKKMTGIGQRNPVGGAGMPNVNTSPGKKARPGPGGQV